MVTVVCVLVAGPVAGYSDDYVRRLYSMVSRHLHRPFRFVCVTDGIKRTPPLVETIQIKGMGKNVPSNGEGYWAKVKLFNPELGLEGRVLYLDLDVLVVNDLGPIVDYPAAFALTEDALVLERAHLDKDRYGRKLVRKFNSSVMVWNAGEQSEIFTRWKPDVALRLSTDQDWIAEQMPEAQGMPLAWFPRISRVQPPWLPEHKVVLVKKPKPHDAARKWDWFEEMWQ